MKRRRCSDWYNAELLSFLFCFSVNAIFLKIMRKMLYLNRLSNCNFHRKCLKYVNRFFCKGVDEWKLCQLRCRGVIKVEGQFETIQKYLQGLITNDVKLLTASNPLIYSLLLNSQSKVHNDLILYYSNSEETNEVLMECDSLAAPYLVESLKKYRIRIKKIEIKDVSKEQHVFHAWNDSKNDRLEISKSDTTAFAPDPRVQHFGWRILAKSLEDIVCAIKNVRVVDEVEYTKRRYQWGIPESVDEIVPGQHTPYHYNFDLMNGVSFKKGCYIGQEAVSRLKLYSGIQRRLFPIVCKGQDTEMIPNRSSILREGTSRSIGNIVSVLTSEHIGLGIFKIKDVQDPDAKFYVMDEKSNKKIYIEPIIPSWWSSFG